MNEWISLIKYWKISKNKTNVKVKELKIILLSRLKIISNFYLFLSNYTAYIHNTHELINILDLITLFRNTWKTESY